MVTTRLPSGIVTTMVTMTHGYNVVTPRYHMITITANFPPHRFSIIASSTGMLVVDAGPREVQVYMCGWWYMVTISHSALRFRTLGDIVTTLLHSCNDGTCYNLVTSRYHMVTITADFPPQRFSIIASSTGVCWSLLHGPERCRCVVGGVWSPYRTLRSDSGHSVTSLLHCYIHVTMGLVTI
jgi:hypothetical protein